MAKRPGLKIVAHYLIVGGEKVLSDPRNTDLPDRCKLALAEMLTGQKHEFKVEPIKGGLT